MTDKEKQKAKAITEPLIDLVKAERKENDLFYNFNDTLGILKSQDEQYTVFKEHLNTIIIEQKNKIKWLKNLCKKQQGLLAKAKAKSFIHRITYNAQQYATNRDLKHLIRIAHTDTRKSNTGNSRDVLRIAIMKIGLLEGFTDELITVMLSADEFSEPIETIQYKYFNSASFSNN